MNNTLQARIHELESTLARLLHEKGREDGGQVKPMVNLTKWMSSPTGSDHAVTLPALDLSSDSEDDAPLSELSESFSGLGKRTRAVSPAWVEKPRVTRRLVNFYFDMVTRFDFLPW
jgi:hypothetical protein